MFLIFPEGIRFQQLGYTLKIYKLGKLNSWCLIRIVYSGETVTEIGETGISNLTRKDAFKKGK
ncbi:MAG TPA: hypothetical protein DCR24_09980 [Bacillus bacterium]|nr:hypothetical protein [Bacillus sp. (in: firmicutes)]